MLSPWSTFLLWSRGAELLVWTGSVTPQYPGVGALGAMLHRNSKVWCLRRGFYLLPSRHLNPVCTQCV